MADKSEARSLRKDGSAVAVYKETVKSKRVEIIEKGANNSFACVSLRSAEEMTALRDFINTCLGT